MLNPLLTHRKNFLVYSLAMAFAAAAHFVILYVFFDFSMPVAAVDSVIYTGLVFLSGIGIWYIVRYLGISDHKYHLVVIDHLITGGILVLIWLFGGYYLLSLLFAGNTGYVSFLSQSLPWRFVYLLLVYALIVMVYYLANYYNNYHEKLLQESAMRQVIQESELNLLKSQINPHFLFNGLNSIHALIMTDAEKAGEMLLELSDFLRYTIRQNHDELVSLDTELEHIAKYLDIEKIRFGQRLVIENNISEACRQRKIPNMILQPVYENAIKHGVNESTDTVIISTTCQLHNGMMQIAIGNNYTPGNLSRRGKGIGLDNIRKRLSLHYRRNDLVQITKKDFIFKVTISIPEHEPVND
jgi:sensor histidine kinase YesM